LSRLVSSRLVSCRRFPRPLNQLLRGLVASFASPALDVRKAVVDCCVELSLSLGDALTPHLQPLLRPEQTKLVEVVRTDNTCHIRTSRL